MLSPEMLIKINQQIETLLPPTLIDAKEQLGAVIQTVLTEVFTKLDLVTRAEFDAQSRLLERTLEKLSHIEDELNQLSNKQ